MKLRTHTRFKRDFKKATRRGRNAEKLWRVVRLLLAGQPLPPWHRPHRLRGNWRGFMECHIEQDWLLIWRRDKAADAIILVRTGSHADLLRH